MEGENLSSVFSNLTLPIDLKSLTFGVGATRFFSLFPYFKA